MWYLNAANGTMMRDRHVWMHVAELTGRLHSINLDTIDKNSYHTAHLSYHADFSTDESHDHEHFKFLKTGTLFPISGIMKKIVLC